MDFWRLLSYKVTKFSSKQPLAPLTPGKPFALNRQRFRPYSNSNILQPLKVPGTPSHRAAFQELYLFWKCPRKRRTRIMGSSKLADEL